MKFTAGSVLFREKEGLMLRRESSGEQVGGIQKGPVVSREKNRERKAGQDEGRVRLGEKSLVPVRHHCSERRQEPWNQRVEMGKARALRRVTEAVKVPRVMTTLSCKRFMTVHRCPPCSITIWRKVRGCVAIDTSSNAPFKIFRF